MKRKIAVVLAAVMLLCGLVGCSAKPKTFTFQDLSITVSSKMRDVTGKNEAWSQYTFALDSSDVAIFGLHEEASLFEEGLTLEEYAELVMDANDISGIPIDRATGDYYYFSFDKALDAGSYRYVAGVYQGEDGFWMVQVASLITDYDETTVFKYLDSVTIG